jgi:hypothetical protein
VTGATPARCRSGCSAHVGTPIRSVSRTRCSRRGGQSGDGA